MKLMYGMINENISSINTRLPKPYAGDVTKLSGINGDDIELVELEMKGRTMYFDVIIKGCEDLKESIDFSVQIIIDTLYQPHIVLAQNIQQNNIGYKIYKKFIEEYGHIYSSKGRRMSGNIIKIINKLDEEPNISCESINGDWLCYLKDAPDIDKVITVFRG